MSLAQDDVARLGQHGLHRHLSVVGERRAHEPDVDRSGPQTGGRIDHAVVAHREMDVRAVLGEAPQRRADQRDHGSRGQPDAQCRASGTACGLQLTQARVESRQRRARVRKQSLARLRQRNATRRSVEQALANPRLELLDLRGERLLGEVQAMRGAREIELLGYRNERAQQPAIEVGHHERSASAP